MGRRRRRWKLSVATTIICSCLFALICFLEKTTQVTIWQHTGELLDCDVVLSCFLKTYTFFFKMIAGPNKDIYTTFLQRSKDRPLTFVKPIRIPTYPIWGIVLLGFGPGSIHQFFDPKKKGGLQNASRASQGLVNMLKSGQPRSNPRKLQFCCC